MLNRDQPANAHRQDNGVDEPVNYLGLTKREHMATMLLSGIMSNASLITSGSNSMIIAAAAAADRLLEVLELTELPAKPDDGNSTPDTDETATQPTGDSTT